MNTLDQLKEELSKYEEQLNDDSLTPEERNDISKKISRIKIKIFLLDV